MSLSVANGKCFVCKLGYDGLGVRVRGHPCFAVGGDLEKLGPKPACLECLTRLRGGWVLANGKHCWCLVCGCETKTVDEMMLLLNVTTVERTILENADQLDDGEGAALYLCDNDGCKVAMCALCLLRHFGPAAMHEAGQASWACPICAGLQLAPFSPAPPPAAAAAPDPEAPPAPPAPAPLAPASPAPGLPTEPAVKKARVDKPNLDGGSSGSSGSGSSGSGSSGSGSSGSGSGSDAE